MSTRTSVETINKQFLPDLGKNVLGILRLKKKKQKLLRILQEHNVEMVSGTQRGDTKWNMTWECYVDHTLGMLSRTQSGSSEILWEC
jgi:hypothetical protein